MYEDIGKQDVLRCSFGLIVVDMSEMILKQQQQRKHREFVLLI